MLAGQFETPPMTSAHGIASHYQPKSQDDVLLAGQIEPSVDPHVLKAYHPPMKRLLWFILPFIFAISVLADPSDVSVYFSPNGGCTEAIVKELGNTKSNILIQAYSFTSAPIAKAVVDAHKRGVDVAVILDKSQRTEKYSEADFLAHAGIRTLIDAKHDKAHNKIMILDGSTVITGSFNFSKSAETSNSENLLIIHRSVLAERYTKNWHEHEGHSEPYAGR